MKTISTFITERDFEVLRWKGKIEFEDKDIRIVLRYLKEDKNVTKN